MDIGAGTLDRLPLLVNTLHDRWCDIDALRFDVEREAVTIPFGGDAAGPKRPLNGVLTITGAKSLDVTDTEHIGVYCLNLLRIDVQRLSITLDADIAKVTILIRESFTVQFH